MAIEILSVSLSDESVARIADAVAAQLLPANRATTESNYPSAQNPQGAESPASAPQADPWQNGGGTPPPPQQPQAPAQNGPVCQHGPMRYVPAGFSQSTGRAYGAFWGCSAPRGAQDKCASVKG